MYRLHSNRTSFRRRWLTLGLLLTIGLTATARAERPSSPRLLPDTTALLVSVTDAQDLRAGFGNTAWGQMIRDPQLRPLVTHLYDSLAQATVKVEEGLGLTLDQMLALPQGEITVALVAPDERPPALVVLFDAEDQIHNARRLLDRLGEQFVRSGARRTNQTVEGAEVEIFDGVGPNSRLLAHFERDGTIVIASDLEVLAQIIENWNGKDGPTLAKNRDFGTIMSRCFGRGDEQSQIAFFADPVNLMRSMGQDDASVQLALVMMPGLGLDGIGAIGGAVAFDAGQLDTIAQGFVQLDSSRSGVLEMLALTSGETAPQRWVPDDVASYLTINWDLQQTFDSLKATYDGFRGEGAFGSLLQRRFVDRLGIDIENDILPAATGRLTHINWIERPITPQSQATLVALELKDAKEFEPVLEKIYRENVAFLDRQAYAGQEYFAISPPKVSDDPAAAGPSPCVALIDGHLMVADRVGILNRVIVALKSRRSLADTPDYQAIAATAVQRARGAKPAMATFSRPEESMRMMYDLAASGESRQGLQRMGRRNPLLRSVGSALDANPLPPFEVIQKYLAPSGALLMDDPNGVYYVWFGLRHRSK